MRGGRQKRRWVTALVIRLALAGLLPIGPFAASLAAERDPVLLLERMGVEDHVREWPELTSLARDRAASDLAPEDLARVQGWLEEAYAPEHLRAEIEEAIRAEGTASRISALEEVATSAALAQHRGRVAHQQGREGLAVQPVRMARVMSRGLDPRRAVAVRRLAAVTGRSRNALAVAVSIGGSIAVAHRGLTCSPEAEAANAAELQRQEIAATARDLDSLVMHLLSLAYWDASDLEIAEVLSAVESPASRWFHSRLSAHLGERLRLSEAALADRVAVVRAERCPHG